MQPIYPIYTAKQNSMPTHMNLALIMHDKPWQIILLSYTCPKLIYYLLWVHNHYTVLQQNDWLHLINRLNYKNKKQEQCTYQN
jgi:hypothetical protein